MFIDIGVSSKEEAEEAGVEVGNMVTPYSEFEVLTNDKYLTAKAFDNRYGCALAVEVLKRLKDENIGINLYKWCHSARRSWVTWCESGSEYN